MRAGGNEKPWGLRGSRAGLAALLCNLPQTPRNKTRKTMSDSRIQALRKQARKTTRHNTPVTSRTGWATYESLGEDRGTPAEMRQQSPTICRNTPVTNGHFCRKPPVTNRPFCRKPPVTTCSQVVDYQRSNFLEILLERVLESRPADSPAGAGGPMPAIRACKGIRRRRGNLPQLAAAPGNSPCHGLPALTPL